jgi:hypothetical protein
MKKYKYREMLNNVPYLIYITNKWLNELNFVVSIMYVKLVSETTLKYYYNSWWTALSFMVL